MLVEILCFVSHRKHCLLQLWSWSLWFWILCISILHRTLPTWASRLWIDGTVSSKILADTCNFPSNNRLPLYYATYLHSHRIAVEWCLEPNVFWVFKMAAMTDHQMLSNMMLRMIFKDCNDFSLPPQTPLLWIQCLNHHGFINTAIRPWQDLQDLGSWLAAWHAVVPEDISYHKDTSYSLICIWRLSYCFIKSLDLLYSCFG